jgi:hypothetical protein
VAAICGESADGLNPMTSLVVGRLAPPLLLAEAIANGFGDVAGRFAKKHDAGEFGEAIDLCFSPPFVSGGFSRMVTRIAVRCRAARPRLTGRR